MAKIILLFLFMALSTNLSYADNNTAQLHDQLKQAIARQDLSGVREAIKKGADVNGRVPEGGTFLMLAAKRTNKDIVKELVDNGAEVNAIKDGITALHCSLLAEDRDSVQFLLENGANANAKAVKNNSLTPIAIAVGTKNIEIVRLLFQYGAEPNIRIKDGITLLALAMASLDLELLELVLQNGADPNMKMNYKSYPLEVAKKINQQGMVILLKKYGAED